MATDPTRGASAPEPPLSTLHPADSRAPSTARPPGLARPARAPDDPVLRSLLELLDDPAPAVWEPVFRELRARGTAIHPHLRRAARSEAPRRRARARALLAGHARRLGLRRLVSYATRRHLNLERALWLFARLDTPRFDRRPYERELDGLAELLREEYRAADSELDRALVLPRFLGERFTWSIPRGAGEAPYGDDELRAASHHPHRIHLHRVLETRRGLPLSLALVWRLVGERLGLKFELLDLPGHVLVRVPAGPRRILVDPASGGEPVSRREVRQYLEAHDIPFGPRLLQPMDDRDLLRRHTANLMRGLGMRGQVGQAEELLLVHELFEG